MSDYAQSVLRNLRDQSDALIREGHARAEEAIRSIPANVSSESRARMEDFHRKMAENLERNLRRIEEIAATNMRI